MLEQISDTWQSNGHPYARFRCEWCGTLATRRLHNQRTYRCRACGGEKDTSVPSMSWLAGRALLCQVVAALTGARGRRDLLRCAVFVDEFITCENHTRLTGERITTARVPYLGPLCGEYWDPITAGVV